MYNCQTMRLVNMSAPREKLQYPIRDIPVKLDHQEWATQTVREQPHEALHHASINEELYKRSRIRLYCVDIITFEDMDQWPQMDDGVQESTLTTFVPWRAEGTEEQAEILKAFIIVRFTENIL